MACMGLVHMALLNMRINTMMILKKKNTLRKRTAMETASTVVSTISNNKMMIMSRLIINSTATRTIMFHFNQISALNSSQSPNSSQFKRP
jgi:hypothetical protein